MNVLRGVLLSLPVLSIAPAEVVRFDAATVGTLPPGWTVAMTHAGGEPQWQVTRDPSAPSHSTVFAQTSQDKTAGRFPLAIWNGASIRNGEVSVAFKTVSGTVDQAAGIVWRYQDPSNYYIVRANALENNIVLYKVENDVRLSIAPKDMPSRSYGVKHVIPKSQWNILRIVFSDTHFSVFFNGAQVFETEDQTFAKAGKTGLWTKADSVTYFDEFTVMGK